MCKKSFIYPLYERAQRIKDTGLQKYKRKIKMEVII